MNARTVAAIKRNRTKRLAKLLTRSIYLYQRKKYDQMANVICDEFVSLGGVYIKFLQGVLLRSEIMKRWHNPDKLKIFENVDSEPLDIASFLQRSLPKHQLAKIAIVQPQPFAAGSFGQVYYGQLRDGRPIIIKVLRPLVRELLNHDLRLLTIFYKRFFIHLYKNVDMDIDQAVNDFKKATLRETDYKHEAEFANELYLHYKDHPKLIVPETITELCTEDMIVQEYVDGISVASLIKMTNQGIDPKTYVKETIGSDLDEQLYLLGYEALMGIFTLPRIMGDPHPGNIRLLPEDKVGLIDFGISAKTPEDKSAFFKLLDAYDQIHKDSMDVSEMFQRSLHFFVGDLYRALNKIGQFAGTKTLNDVSKVASESFEKMTGFKAIVDNPKSDGNILQVINKIFNRNNRFGLVLKLENSEILRAVQTFTAMVGALGRNKKIIPKVLDKVVSDVKSTYPEMVESQAEETSLADSIETVIAWLERVAVRDPQLFYQLSTIIRHKSNIMKSGENNV